MIWFIISWNESKPAIFKLHAKPSTVSRLPKPLNFYDQYKTWRDLENGLLASLRYARNTNCRLTGIHCWLAFNWTLDNLSDSKSRPDYFYSFCLDYNRGLIDATYSLELPTRLPWRLYGKKCFNFTRFSLNKAASFNMTVKQITHFLSYGYGLLFYATSF